jgi:hypothetical protein
VTEDYRTFSSRGSERAGKGIYTVMTRKHDKLLEQFDRLVQVIDNEDLDDSDRSLQYTEFGISLSDVRRALLNALSVGREVRRSPK